MLTRLEADGFKNLLDFKVDFGPFTCIAGPNGVGKSNIFDALRFLSLLAEFPFTEAVKRVRGTDPNSFDPRDLFWNDGHHYANQMTFSVEMIVGQEVTDDFGRTAKATSTFLRYELALAYEEASQRGELGRLRLQRESLVHINKGDAHKHLHFDMNAAEFRDRIIQNNRSGTAYISSNTLDDGSVAISIHGDGGSRGPARKVAATHAPRTMIGTLNEASTPTVLAAKREMQNWRFLALEPSAMRQPDPFTATTQVVTISDRGAHLPATLHRIATSYAEDESTFYKEIAARLAKLMPIRELSVDVDEVRQLLSIRATEQSGLTVSAHSLSDGTLRFLALAILSATPQAPPLICMEEPENGIHPATLPAMVDLLQDIAVDPKQPPSPENPLRQVIIATHSPHLVQLMYEDDILVARTPAVRQANNTIARALELRPLTNTWRAKHNGHTAESLAVLENYLVNPSGTPFQLRLERLTTALVQSRGS
ncbi:MAG: AAA family ATPase [Anaerolineales bacterium]|nr:AAA family ATPase [Anaerolineales bacterium]MCB9129146.1 AAA family ATPase [Ardenticatenales bacterium]